LAEAQPRREDSGTFSGIDLGIDLAATEAMTRFAAALMWGAVTLGSCSVEHLGASRDGNADTPTALLDAVAADRCSGSISDVGGRCQATFDGSVADLPTCSGVGQTVNLCGGMIALAQGTGFTALTCYYDVATHVLVGALEQSDSPGFCGDSFGRFAGQIPGPSCDTIAPSFRRSCFDRDGGAD
jgi:hypothetical protein